MHIHNHSKAFHIPFKISKEIDILLITVGYRLTRQIGSLSPVCVKEKSGTVLDDQIKNGFQPSALLLTRTDNNSLFPPFRLLFPGSFYNISAFIKTSFDVNPTNSCFSSSRVSYEPQFHLVTSVVSRLDACVVGGYKTRR